MKFLRDIRSRLQSGFGKLPKLTFLFPIVQFLRRSLSQFLILIGKTIQSAYTGMSTFRLDNLKISIVHFFRKHLKKLLVAVPILILFAGAVGWFLLRSETEEESEALFASGEMILSAEWEITAGDVWEVTVEVIDGSPGQVIQVIIMNGLQRHDETLQLGSGGIAVLRIPEATLNYAGQSLIIAQAGDEEIRETLTILPDEPQTIDSMTTANSLTAYGERQGMIMSFAADVWGNPVTDDTLLNLAIRYPDSRLVEATYETKTGFIWDWLPSNSMPGRTRLTFSIDDLSDSLEINQTPGIPAQMMVEASPSCLLNDERDVITLTAHVSDGQGYPVTDGTMIRFEWLDGFGTAPVINGIATLRLPAPQVLGLHRYRAVAGNVLSEPAVVRVARGECAP